MLASDPEPSSARSAYCNAAIQCGWREELVVPRHLLCSNGGAGSLFPTIIGYLNHLQLVGISIAICSATAVMLLLLPETHGPQSCNFGDRGGRRSIVVAYLFAELTISATAHLALSFPNVVRAKFRERRRPKG